MNLAPGAREDIEGLKVSAACIKNMINDIIAKENATHQDIILGGFSQGGALSLYYALSENDNLGGVIAHSSYLPGYLNNLQHQNLPKDRPTNVLFIHGDTDMVVSIEWGKKSYEVYKKYFPNSKFKEINRMG